MHPLLSLTRPHLSLFHWHVDRCWRPSVWSAAAKGEDLVTVKSVTSIKSSGLMRSVCVQFVLKRLLSHQEWYIFLLLISFANLQKDFSFRCKYAHLLLLLRLTSDCLWLKAIVTSIICVPSRVNAISTRVLKLIFFLPQRIYDKLFVS